MSSARLGSARRHHRAVRVEQHRREHRDHQAVTQEADEDDDVKNEEGARVLPVALARAAAAFLT